MTLNEFLSLTSQAALLLIVALTLINYLRYRDATRLSIVLLFIALAYIFIVQNVREFRQVEDTLDRILVVSTQIALMSHPFLLLRLIVDFRPVPDWVWQVGLGGMVISWLLLIVSPTPLPLVIVVLMVAYFVFVEAYAALSFARGAWLTAGVTRWRLGLAGVGSGLLALAVLLIGVTLPLPQVTTAVVTLNQFLALFAFLAYFLAFATPRWLRRHWQLTELYRFIQFLADPAPDDPTAVVLQRLCQSAMRAVGGAAAVVALWNEQEGRLVVRASTNPVLVPPGRVVGSIATQQVWEAGESIVSHLTSFSVDETPLAATLGTAVFLATPIATRQRAWGILQVFDWRTPLFAKDDLNLLALFAEQTAVALSYATLLSEQRHLIQELEQRSQQLEIAFKELEAFSYSVSHDLRAPLRHVSGYIDLLRQNVPHQVDATAERYMTIIQSEATRMGMLIDDLLAFSRFGRSEMHYTAVDFNRLITQTLTEFEEELRDREVIWHIDALPTVWGDEAMLRLVLNNLLSNALKFSQERPLTKIEIGCTANANEDIFFIRDNGAGFDMQYADQLFGVFQRLHHTTEFHGTGIGLANVRRIIQRHGGRTWAEGAVDGGATFYFTLPHKSDLATAVLSPQRTVLPAGDSP